MTNDNLADAVDIVIAVNGDTVSMPPVPNTGFGTEGTTGPYPVFRDAWWRYRVGRAGFADIDVQQSTPTAAGVRCELCQGSTPTDLYIGADNAVTDSTTIGGVISAYLTIDQPCYIRVSTIDDVDATYVVRVTGPAGIGDGTAMHGAATVSIFSHSTPTFDPAGTLHGSATLTCGAAATAVYGGGGSGTLSGIAAFAVTATGAASYPRPALANGHGTAYPASLITATITAEAPANGAAVPGTTPTFAVDVVTVQRGLTAVVEYDTGPAFTHPIRLTNPITTGQAVLHELLRVTTPLIDGDTYYWRAYVENATGRTIPTTPRALTISHLDGDAVIGGRWTVTTATTAVPHLWYVFPGRSTPGSVAVAYGTGFGPSTVTASVNGTPGTVTAFTAVAPAAAAYTAQRAIIPGTGLADPYHQTVAFTVPVVDPPGGILYLDGS
jgi:hypothetical protein